MTGQLRRLHGLYSIKTFLLCYLMCHQINCQRTCLGITNSEYVCKLRITGPNINVFCYNIDANVPLYNFTIVSQFAYNPIQDMFSLIWLFNQPIYSNTSNFYACPESSRVKMDDLRAMIPNYLSFCSIKHNCFTLASEITGYSYLYRLPLFIFPNVSEIAIHNNDHILLSYNSFYNLPKLQDLNLSSNNLTLLPIGVFQTARSLKNLNLSNNKLSDITSNLDDSDIFYYQGKLSSLDLSHNEIRDLPWSIFYYQRNLHYLDLSYNEIHDLPSDIFSYKRHLDYLDLSHNEIHVLPLEIFYYQKSLSYLDLSYNKLVSCDNYTFYNLEYLTTLLLNNNALVLLPPEIFLRTPNLKTLDLSENHLIRFDENLVKNLQNLDILNLSRNVIKHVELGVRNVVYVRSINFSRNEITHLNISWNNLVKLENIDFDFNNITYVKLPTCRVNKKLVNASFRQNYISNIGLPDFTEKDIICGFQINYWLSNNPLNCDWKLFSVYTYIRNWSPWVKIIFLLPDSNNNMYFILYNSIDSTIRSLREDVFLCPIEENCPAPCKCGIRGLDGRTLVNCTSTGLDNFPNFAPSNTTVLHFQRNKLISLNQLDIDVWENLTELRLDNNLIESTDISKFPRSLRKLTLADNRIQYLNPSLQEFISSHGDFYLMIGNNSWNCNCNTKAFKTWLLKYTKNIKDIDNITCKKRNDSTNQTLPLYQIPDSVLCINNEKKTNENLDIITTSVISILIILALLSTVFYYKYQQVLIPFLYIHCRSILLCCYGEEDVDKDKMFDAFIAYSSHDHKIVMELMKELENKDPYFKLCIHERDWMPGNFISQNIVYSIMHSKRTLVVLSENFVSSIWFEIEVRAAFFQMLQDKTNRLVVIVVEKFPNLDTMDHDIQQILKLKTYLVWEERWFWEKLRYVMPHKVEVPAPKKRIPRYRDDMVDMVEYKISAAMNSTQIKQNINS